jgi:hypothetical protein
MAEDISREIRAQYIIAYKPKRPFFEASALERRQVKVLSRRVGLHLLVLRDSVAPRAYHLVEKP